MTELEWTKDGAARASDISDKVRALLKDACPRENPAVVAAALSYTIAAVIGEHLTDDTDIEQCLHIVNDVMRAQLATFGRGVEHP